MYLRSSAPDIDQSQYSSADSPDEMAETVPRTLETSVGSLPTPQTESASQVQSASAWVLAQTRTRLIATRIDEGETGGRTREVSRSITDTGNPTSSVSECQTDETEVIDG